jgi:hypothetical protein
MIWRNLNLYLQASTAPSSSNSSNPSTSSGPLFKSATAASSASKPTFPSAAAVSASPPPSATITGAPQIKKPESSSGLTSKLMHPDEDISLVSSVRHCGIWSLR